MGLEVTDLGARVAALPGMDVLLPALEGLAPAYLVGGAVRDLLRGEASLDLDLAVEGDAPAVAESLAERLGGSGVAHDRFGTATVRADDVVLDLAATRRERYPRPGALPEVEPADLAEDLRRRDFTVNAMAVALTGPDFGTLHDPLDGASGPRSRGHPGPPRPLVPRRPHTAPARAALRGPAGIRAGPRHRAPGAGGVRGRGPGHGLGRRASATS